MNRTQAAEVYEAMIQSSPGAEAGDLAARLFIEAVIDLGYEETIAAMVTLQRQRVFLSASEIRTQVRKVREERIAKHEQHEELIPPAGMTPGQEIVWLRAARKAVGDGRPVPDNGRVLGHRTLAELLAPPTDQV